VTGVWHPPDKTSCRWPAAGTYGKNASINCRHTALWHSQPGLR